MNPRFRTPLIAVAAALATFLVGFALGGQSDGTANQLIDKVTGKFYKPVKKSSLEQASLKGIVSSLHDRYSEYFTPAEAKAFTQSLNGQFEGVGMTIDSSNTKKGLLVRMVFDGSPAKAAGIGAGDLIVGVNGKTTVGKPADVSTGAIRGPAGTSVSLAVRRGGTAAPHTVKVQRKQIDVPLVQSRIVQRNGKKFAVIRLFQFSRGAHTQVSDAVKKAVAKGAQGIALDLRGNPGGELTEGRDVPSLFVGKGLIVSTRGLHSPEQKLYATGNPVAPTIPMVVLVDHGSASAAEIAAGALRDDARATIVGEKTFGKGVFQQVESLQNGGLLKLTVGSYYLPKGENLAGDGINPQVRAHDNPKTKRDEALPVALRTLQAKLK
jgi:carboxyl-terminal processing protease